MTTVLYSIIIVSVIGLIAGAGLSIASVLMKVPTDEKFEKIRQALPGANCGACGFSGCDGYATALSKGETDNTALCAPGGKAAAEQIAMVLGVDASESMKRIAVVRCMGTRENTDSKVRYSGIKTCRAAKQLFAGGGDCAFGCIGFGDCERVCPSKAIHLCNGLASIDPALCTGCGLCAAECPKSIISVVPAQDRFTVRCRNADKGIKTRQICRTGCIGCGLCSRKCPEGAITVENSLAYIDPEKCVGCGECASACPRKCIL